MTTRSTWVQRYVEEAPPGRLWALVLAGRCPWSDWDAEGPRCSYAPDHPHAHHIREDGGDGIVTDELRAIGVPTR